ncbi:hypothetical protein P618_201019 [Holospora obtusa F1]|uniref:Uncharacterized protein n=1 Tax=Holospora obtusa F1 TaxID=1399147 RepID=W6TSM4_HOLOB|nr:hypothetical protein [Holospora obtusa]ETZ06802.1 hypothetical protein P618_201019 [Holospora obtusa F1]
MPDEITEFMHRVIPMEIRSLFTLRKVRTMIWNGGDALMDHLVKAGAVLADEGAGKI